MSRGHGVDRAGPRGLVVERTGPQALVVDLGRPGLAHLGVPRAGALDPPALRLANRLVGNDDGSNGGNHRGSKDRGGKDRGGKDRGGGGTGVGAAGLEVLLGGLVVRADGAGTVAVTGPPVPVWVERGGRRSAVGSHRAVFLDDGDRLVLGAPDGGMRCYLAVSGGVDVPPVLGSRSADLLSGLGPAPVRDGDRVPRGAVSGSPPGLDGPVPASLPPSVLDVPLLLGPRDDWFTDPAGALRTTTWTVSERSNRIGLRLDGPRLTRVPDRDGRELPSEPMLTGAVQVPPSGRPVIFLADGPTTGGYPVVGVVTSEALASLAQARPGSTLRLHPAVQP